jgi:ABC-type nitrate/sulfonate/bicarbonate transport system substrate-binding protein
MLVAIPPINAEQVLRQHQVEMASLGDLYRERAIETGGIRSVFSDHELFGEFTAGSYVMKKDFIRKNPQAARRFVEGVGRALDWSRTTSREQVVARMTAIIAKRHRTEDANALKYWKSYGVAGQHGCLTDRDFQLWIDWMVRDGALKPGQLKAQALYTNELNR